MLRAGAVGDESVRAHAAAAVVARVADRDSIGVAGLSGCENDAWESGWPRDVVVARDEDETRTRGFRRGHDGRGTTL